MNIRTYLRIKQASDWWMSNADLPGHTLDDGGALNDAINRAYEDNKDKFYDYKQGPIYMGKDNDTQYSDEGKWREQYKQQIETPEIKASVPEYTPTVPTVEDFIPRDYEAMTTATPEPIPMSTPATTTVTPPGSRVEVAPIENTPSSRGYGTGSVADTIKDLASGKDAFELGSKDVAGASPEIQMQYNNILKQREALLKKLKSDSDPMVQGSLNKVKARLEESLRNLIDKAKRERGSMWYYGLPIFNDIESSNS